VGVSIIWCAILGWILMEKYVINNSRREFSYSNGRLNNNLVNITFGADSLAIIYYAVEAEAITSLAHCCVQ
jgi:hypothetical protein